MRHSNAESKTNSQEGAVDPFAYYFSEMGVFYPSTLQTAIWFNRQDVLHQLDPSALDAALINTLEHSDVNLLRVAIAFANTSSHLLVKKASSNVLSRAAMQIGRGKNSPFGFALSRLKNGWDTNHACWKPSWLLDDIVTKGFRGVYDSNLEQEIEVTGAATRGNWVKDQLGGDTYYVVTMPDLPFRAIKPCYDYEKTFSDARKRSLPETANDDECGAYSCNEERCTTFRELSDSLDAIQGPFYVKQGRDYVRLSCHATLVPTLFDKVSNDAICESTHREDFLTMVDFLVQRLTLLQCDGTDTDKVYKTLGKLSDCVELRRRRNSRFRPASFNQNLDEHLETIQGLMRRSSSGYDSSCDSYIYNTSRLFYGEEAYSKSMPRVIGASSDDDPNPAITDLLL